MDIAAPEGDAPYHGACGLGLIESTANTHQLIMAASQAAKAAWRSGHRYSKAGIVLTELVPGSYIQENFLDDIDRDKGRRLMQALDAVNHRFGRSTLVPAAAGIGQKWATKADMRSPRYTTRWGELPVVTA